MIILLCLIIIMMLYIIILIYKKYCKTQHQINYLLELRDNSSRSYKLQELNRKRVLATTVVFPNRINDNFIIVKDDLDSQNKTIAIYITDKTMDIPYIDNLKEIAKIELDSEENREGNIFYKVNKLYVVDGYRRNKIGTLLLKRVIEWAKIRNVKQLYLYPSSPTYIMSQKELVAFYKQLGFISDKSSYMKLDL